MESTVTDGLSRSKSARAGVERYQELGPPARERRNAAGVSRALRLGEMHALVHPLSPGRAQKTQPAYRGRKRERAARERRASHGRSGSCAQGNGTFAGARVARLARGFRKDDDRFGGDNEGPISSDAFAHRARVDRPGIAARSPREIGESDKGSTHDFVEGP